MNGLSNRTRVIIYITAAAIASAGVYLSLQTKDPTIALLAGTVAAAAFGIERALASQAQPSGETQTPQSNAHSLDKSLTTLPFRRPFLRR